MDRVLMEAWADADKGPALLELYCEPPTAASSVMFLPHRALVPEGPARITLTIDNAKPVVLEGDAFGDDDTDVVTVHDTARHPARHHLGPRVAVHYLGGEGKTGRSVHAWRSEPRSSNT